MGCFWYAIWKLEFMDIDEQFLDFATNILACATTDDVWDLHTQKMCEYGFDRLLFLSTNLRTHGEWGDISDTLVLSTYPQEVVDVFVDGGLYKRASVVPRKDHKPGFHSWRNFMERKAAGDLTEAEIELSGLHAKWKIAAGYTIWFDETSNRIRSVVGLCARQGLTQDDVDKIWSEQGKEIFVLNTLVHLKMLQLPRTGQYPSMTTRQREVLQWVADGKTVKDIAQIMDLSPTTIDKHLNLARKTLGVETTGQAVQKALVLNLLNVV